MINLRSILANIVAFTSPIHQKKNHWNNKNHIIEKLFQIVNFFLRIFYKKNPSKKVLILIQFNFFQLLIFFDVLSSKLYGKIDKKKQQF